MTSTLLLLGACGAPKYDEAMKSVLEDVNNSQNIDNESGGSDVKTNLSKENCDFYVYDGGNVVRVDYEFSTKSDKKIKVYYKKTSDGNYESDRKYNLEFDESNPDYVEIAGKEKSLN